MALIHLAYTFDSESFHSTLRSEMVRDGKLDAERLHSHARSVVENASSALRKILNDLRYDDDWLDDPDGDSSQSYLWYMIVLASVFKPCPSLSNNRSLHSHLILERILPLAGWSESDVHALILAKHLDTFLDDPKDRIFADDLTLYGGALNIKQTKALLAQLESGASAFSATPETLNLIADITKYSTLQPDEILDRAYWDAHSMLETAIQRNEALYLFREA